MKISKWVTIIIITSIIITLLCGYHEKKYAEDSFDVYTDIEEMQLIKATVNKYPLKTYNHIAVADGENEYFVVHNAGETVKIVDKGNRMLLDTEKDGEFDFDMGWYGIIDAEGYLTIEDRRSTVVVNIDKLSIIKTSYDYVDIHCSGEYMLGINYEWDEGEETNPIKYTVEKMDGTVLYESEYSITLAKDEGYLCCMEDGNSCLFNLYTGQAEYIAEKGYTVENRIFGYTVIKREMNDESIEFLILDENFNIAMDGQIFKSVEVYENYICTTAIDDYFDQVTLKTADNKNNLNIPIVYDMNGKCIYKGPKGYSSVVIYKDILVYEKEINEKYKFFYARLPKGDVQNE